MQKDATFFVQLNCDSVIFCQPTVGKEERRGGQAGRGYGRYMYAVQNIGVILGFRVDYTNPTIKEV